ncbi:MULTISPECIES: GNAT family N-acetyltransferase [Streptomyces]|uniref:GNAT family N-acetyltransferase n=1 Tax=Streptomyces TaxID=1883 RepID=UPI00163C2A35|nr:MULTISPECIES: GNAT family N-acetyltransferase [Streptomyces]MBC2875150.1 GNAT family N-acetyltransferase [Streptomyces sp. TYQ1024]UBI36983.1 GNAT family N-acetyltransferase [Streptomyces mobaraensis]UKW29576.1 GNAT family N-acetyltransferase [Streptomyces sp. TYQ1024]
MEFTTGGRLEIRISSEDVGKRVSVRALNDRTSSPERFADAVGVLTSWTDGVLRITRRDGRTVEVAEDALVAGKVVPAAPARRRGPAATLRELQDVAARGWPATETGRLGDWALRAAGGFTARANSALPLGRSGLPLPEAVDRVTAWYHERGLPARVQVTTGDPAEDERLDAGLAARGWTAERYALMRTAALAPVADAAEDVDQVLLSREPDEAWLEMYGRVENPGAARAVLAGGPSVWCASVPGAAIGRCVVDGRWAGFAALEVSPEHRRKGLATRVMAALARRALNEGASAAYLQVETGNAGALALYDRLGFTTHHAYHYRREPEH